MTVSNVFSEFCSSIKLIEDEHWLSRLKEITKKINEKYYKNGNDDHNHRLLVGSIGRKTATNDASDYDVLFSLPWDVYHRFDKYSDNGQKYLLQEIRTCIRKRYPKTNISGDGQVVDVSFDDGLIEVVPGFENKDGSFTYPDSNHGGSWKKTNPRPEKQCCTDDGKSSNGTFRDITRMIRVWKNHKGIVLKGLLIDTFADDYYQKHQDQIEGGSYKSYPSIMKDMFEYLKDRNPEQHYWYALGSNQHIGNDDNSEFIDKSQEAFDDLNEIDLNDEDEVLHVFSDLFGEKFVELIDTNQNAAENEEFAVDKFSSIDIRGTFKIKCNVSQKGLRTHSLAYYIEKFSFVKKEKYLLFEVTNLKIPDKYSSMNLSFYWKIRNYGDEAQAKNQLRGEIIRGGKKHKEHTLYRSMKHYVECFIVAHKIVIARNKIIVPIGDF